MADVSGVGMRRHFSTEEEEALRRDESTNSIVKRDAKTSVDVRGKDPTWVETKHHQQGPMENKIGAADVAFAAFDAAGAAGIHVTGGAFVQMVVGGLEVASPVLAFGLGLHQLHEAHAKGDEQARALAQDNAHVAVIGALDLPESYKAARLGGDYKHVAKGPNSPAFRATEALLRDKPGLATLQLHADRGMNRARDCARSGMPVDQFLRANPKIAEQHEKDAAFHEGFEAYLDSLAKLPPDQMKALELRLEERDGWYAQSRIQVRV